MDATCCAVEEVIRQKRWSLKRSVNVSSIGVVLFSVKNAKKKSK